MSVSEKMKWLGERNTDDDLTIGAALIVLDVLPQIMAVVKALEQQPTLEWLEKATDAQNAELKRRAENSRAALLALDEALP